MEVYAYRYLKFQKKQIDLMKIYDCSITDYKNINRQNSQEKDQKIMTNPSPSSSLFNNFSSSSSSKSSSVFLAWNNMFKCNRYSNLFHYEDTTKKLQHS